MRRGKKINEMTKAELIGVLREVDPVLDFLGAIESHTEYLADETLEWGLLFRWTGSADLYAYMVRRVSEKLGATYIYRGRRAVDWQRFARYIEGIPQGPIVKNVRYPKGADEIDKAIEFVEKFRKK